MTSLYKNTSILELTSKDFNYEKKITVKNQIFKNRNGLIVIYAPWCVHCQNMVQDYIELGNLFKNKFILSAINSEDIENFNDELIRQLHVKEFPTFKYVTNSGNIINYKGQTGKEDIMYFICSKEKTCI